MRVVGHHQVLQLHRPVLVVDEHHLALKPVDSNHNFFFNNNNKDNNNIKRGQEDKG